jgi:hypothetical protein
MACYKTRAAAKVRGKLGSLQGAMPPWVWLVSASGTSRLPGVPAQSTAAQLLRYLCAKLIPAQAPTRCMARHPALCTLLCSAPGPAPSCHHADTRLQGSGGTRHSSVSPRWCVVILELPPPGDTRHQRHPGRQRHSCSDHLYALLVLIARAWPVGLRHTAKCTQPAAKSNAGLQPDVSHHQLQDRSSYPRTTTHQAPGPPLTTSLRR